MRLNPLIVAALSASNLVLTLVAPRGPRRATGAATFGPGVVVKATPPTRPQYRENTVKTQHVSYSPGCESLEGKLLLAANVIGPVIPLTVIVQRQITPVVIWNNPAPITYGTKIDATQLNAVATVPGTFSYLPAVGTILQAGQNVLYATFAPADPITYSGFNVATTLNVQKATPTVVWNAPTGLKVGDLYPSNDQNATAFGVDGKPLAGTFECNMQPGEKLTCAGINMASIGFVPNDQNNYNTCSKTDNMIVAAAPPVAPKLYIPVAPVTLNSPYLGKNVISPPLYVGQPQNAKHPVTKAKNAVAPKPVKHVVVQHAVAKHPVVLKAVHQAQPKVGVNHPGLKLQTHKV